MSPSLFEGNVELSVAYNQCTNSFGPHWTRLSLQNLFSCVGFYISFERNTNLTPGQPPKSHYPEHPTPESKKSKPNHKASIIPPANYGPIKGAQAAGLQSGTGNKETLTELGLVPQSVLLIKFTGAGDEDLNSSGYPAPLKEELREKKVPLPPPQVKESGNGESTAAPKTEVKTEKKIPK